MHRSTKTAERAGVQTVSDFTFFPVQKQTKKSIPVRQSQTVYVAYHMRGKISEGWLAETEGIFNNHGGTFGNQEGMITWSWLV